MRKFKKLFKEITVWLVVFTMVSWSASIPFTSLVPETNAAGGVEVVYINDGGATDEVFLSSSSTPEAFLKITAFDLTAGTNTLDSITIQLEPGMNCTTTQPPVCADSPFVIGDLGSITATASSGISLFLDDGDDTFELYGDTLISSTTATKASAWTTRTITDDWGSFNVSETTFSNLNLTIPVSFSSKLTVFVVARAENNIDASTLRKFMPRIPQNGVNVTSASATDWPSDSNGMGFMPVTLGTEGSGSNMQESAPLVISEIQIASSTAAVEFIEIKNKTNQSYDLIPSNGTANADVAIADNLNLHIVDCTGAGCTGTTTNPTLTLTTNDDTGDDIPANGFFLIASTNWNTSHAADFGTPDATYDASANGMNANGGVYISASSTVDTAVIDKIGWGSQTQTTEGIAAISPPTNGSLERKAYPSSNSTSMLGVDASRGNDSDTNNNSADFVPRANAGPQNTSSTAEDDEFASSARNVVINEILYNTASSSSWIELYNASSSAISINNWILEVATSTAQTYTIPNISINAQSFAVIYWNQTGANDTDTSDGQGAIYTGNAAGMSTYGGDITLKNSGSAIIDYVQFGGSGKAGESAAAAAGQWTAGDFKAGSEYGESIARIGTVGDDFNSSSDWMYLSAPTPNLPNTGGDSTAPNTATNVQLSDPDSAGWGLTGQDVRISWAPSSTSDPSFDRYEVYLLPDGTALNTASHSVYSTLYGQYMWESGAASSSYAFIGTGGEAMARDSAGAFLSTGDYRAYVISVDMAGNKSSAVSSAAATLTAEDASAAGADATPPMIDHMPVWQAPVNTDLTFYTRMGDDRSLVTAQLAYKTTSPDTAWGNATSTCSAPAMAGNTGLYACTVAWNGAWDADTTLHYYLRAIDATGNDTYLGMYSANTESTVKTNSINIDFIAAATWNDAGAVADLSGTVFDSTGNPLQDAFVIIDGIATTTATTTATGTFTFQDNALPAGPQFIRIIKDGYQEKITDTDNNSSFIAQNASGLEFYLNSGSMNTSAGGSSGGSGVAWTAPMDGMMMSPTDISCTGDCSTIGAGEMPIIIGFFNAMNSNTINDMDASNAGSNIYLTSDGNTKVAGIKVKYDSGNNEARIYSATALSADTFYTVVLTSNVLDASGNPLKPNRPSGNYEFSFSTMSDNSSMWGAGGNDYSSFGGGGMYMPPYVVGTNPTPGAYNVPLGAVLTVEFSEAMDATSINTTNIKLYRITNESSWTATEVTDKNISVSLDNATKKIVTLSHDALDANASNNGWYEIRVMAAAKSQLGMWLGTPTNCGAVSPDTCLSTQVHYTSSFQVASTADTTAPTVAGSYPSNNDGITAGTTAVDVAVPALEIGFSEAMNPSTINSQNITLKRGTVSAAGVVNYDPMSNSAKFTPSSALTANSVYTMTITTSVTDLSGNALASNNIISFKTGSADTASPEVLYANGDDYQIAVTFSEPMNAAPQTDTANWTTSVLNPANYYVNSLTEDASCSTPGSWSCSPTVAAPYNTNDGNQASSISGLTLAYDAMTQTVTLKGLDMCGGAGFASCTADSFQIFVDNATDKSNNAITDTGNRASAATHLNASRSPLQNSASTYGMLGPGGGPGMMMGGGGPGGSGSGAGPSMDMNMMGMFSAGAFPMNAMAGQTSAYALDIPVTKKLQDGMQIIITFPTGFDVSGVSTDAFSPINSDMNEWNGGTVTWDTTYGVGGIASTTSRTITLKLNIATSSTNTLNTAAGPDGFIDSLHIDIKGVKNSSIPKDFGTSGYTADIKTKSSDGALLENITTMPFFITEGGSDSLTVVINSGNAGQNTGTMTVYLGSFMTGPMEAESTAFSGGYATSTFSNLLTGDYMIFTDPFITIDTTDYLGKPMPEFIQVSGATSKTITIEEDAASATKAAVSVYLQGDYSTGGVADDVDVFAHSPSSFRVKTLTSVGSTNPNTTIYLTEGDWGMGVGPAMPKGAMAGPPKMPDWMEPAMVKLTVGIETVTATSGSAAIGNSTAIGLTVASLDYFKVGDAIAFANAGAVTGSATTTITAIDYANKIITATPGDDWTELPDTTTVITSVRETSKGDNDTNVYFNISTQTLKNIIGFVVDGSGNGMGDTEVYAYQPQGFGGGRTTTDTSGKFTLKIGANGVWTIGAFKPGMPNAQEKSVEVRADSGNAATDGNSTADVYLNGALIADASGDNTGTNPLRLKLKRPSYTISGKVLNSSNQAIPYAPVWAYEATSWGHADTMTDATGAYILYVDAGAWTVEADAPGVGWLQYDTTVTITTASQSNINLKPDTNTTFYSVAGTITIDGSAQSYIPLRAMKYDADGNYLGKDFNASTDVDGAYTISLPEGLYRIDTWAPSYGELELVFDQLANSPANINVNAATTTADITVAANDLQTVSVQFNNGSSTQTGFLYIEEMDYSTGDPIPTGYRFSTDISGLQATTTLKLKGSASGNYYFFNLDVPGYGFFTPTTASRNLLSNTYDNIKVTNAARAVYFDLPNLSTGVVTISGTVQDTAAAAVANAWAWVSNPSSNFDTGAETGSDGTFSITVPSLSSGSYKLGAGKPGYMSPASATVSGSANSANNTLTLTDNTRTISGNVYADANSNNSYDSGEGLPNSWVWAEETSTGQMVFAPADATGAYELGVADNTTWKVFAGSDGYLENAYRVSNTKTDVSVTTASVANINISLSVDSNWTQKTKSKPITPSSGGIIDDSADSGTGVKITIPPNALGSDSNSGNVVIKDTSSVSQTSSAVPFGGLGKTISATDNSGNAITNLNDYIEVEITYYKADISNMNIIDYSKLKNLNGNYWDATLNNWVSQPTTRKAYYKLLSTDTEWTLKPDNASASQTGYEEFIDTLVAGTPTYYDYKLVFTTKTDHLTVYGATQPQDGLLPSSPSGLSQTAGSGTSVTVSWNAVTTNTDSTAITDLLAYEIYRSTDDSTYTQQNTSDIASTTRSYTDSSTSAWTSYYYKVTAADDGGNETALANSTALRVCSTSSVSNGAVSADCSFTCNSGYTKNTANRTCAVSAGGGISTTQLNLINEANQTTAEETTEETAETVTEKVEKVITETKEVVVEATDTAKQAAQEFAKKIVAIASDAAEIVKANINALLGKLGFKRELAKEQVAVKKYVKRLIKDAAGLPAQSQHALTNFVAYGTETTLKLGEGERAGVVNSYKAAFGKLPADTSDWNDVVKIANGRWPSERSETAEDNATNTFKKIYLREPDRTKAHDDAAVTVMSYGLRPADRNLNSEKAAIKIFKNIYRYNPVSATDWDAVRAIAYSGATR